MVKREAPKAVYAVGFLLQISSSKNRLACRGKNEGQAGSGCPINLDP